MVVAAADNVEALLEKTAVYRQRLSPFSRVLASKLGKKREGMELLRAAGIVLLVLFSFSSFLSHLARVVACSISTAHRVRGVDWQQHPCAQHHCHHACCIHIIFVR